MPRSGSSAIRPRSVISGVLAMRCRIQSRSPASLRLRCPPILPGATLPVVRRRCDQRTTLDALTMTVEATERTLSPATTRKATRSRKSIE